MIADKQAGNRCIPVLLVQCLLSVLHRYEVLVTFLEYISIGKLFDAKNCALVALEHVCIIMNTSAQCNY